MATAWILHEIGDIRLENIKVKEPADNAVIVKVRASGICGSDIDRIYKRGAHKMPLVPGHEFAGVVESVGDSVDKSLIGKPVGVFPLIPCGKCEFCKKKKYQLCTNYNYIGSRCDGGFAELVEVPVNNLQILESNIDFCEAAMLEPMAVAVHAMRLATNDCTIDKDSIIAVCGLGTIGLSLVMFLIEAGYTNIIAIGKREGQCKRAVSLGVSKENYCDCRSKDLLEEIANVSKRLKDNELNKDIGKKSGDILSNENVSGPDIFFDCVGGDTCIRIGINSIIPGGKICLVGNPLSNVNFIQEDFGKILRKELLIIGSWNSSFTHKEDDDWSYVLKRLENKSIDPSKLITHRLKLSGLTVGLDIMRDKDRDSCKVMLEMRE